MSIPGSVNPLFLGASGQATGYQISRSLRFNSADSAYLSRTPASSGNRKTWTWAGWVKRSKSDSFNAEIFGAGSNNLSLSFIGDNINIYEYNGASTLWQKTSTAVYRDFSAWYHVTIAYDTTQSTATNRVKIYVNGIEITAFSANSDPSLNYDGYVNSAIAHYIGRQAANNRYFNGYLAECFFLDDIAADPSSFTETDATTGQLIPKAYTGSYGTNGFRLPFSDNSTAAALGTDTSGNGNDWTVNNLIAGPAFTSNSWSGYFDGSGDSLTVTNNAVYDFGSGSFTIEGWAYPTTASQLAFAARTQSQGFEGWIVSTTNFLATTNGSSWDVSITFSSALTANSWNHVAIVRNGNVYTAYLNGVANGTTTVSGSIVAGTTVAIIGQRAGQTDYSGYISNFRIVKGTAVYTTAFTPPTTPLTAVSNTSLLTLQSSTLIDNSPNNFTITANGNARVDFRSPFEESIDTDSLVDTPTSYGTDTGAGGEVRGNYATLNALRQATGSGASLANGNLDFTCVSAATGSQTTFATFGVSSGKYYFEMTVGTAGGYYPGIGINTDLSLPPTSQSGDAASGYMYLRTGNKYTSYSITSYGSSYTTGDVVGVALDLDAGTITFYKNGSSQGQAFSGITGTAVPCIVGLSNASGSLNFGQRAFAYPLSGFKALCTTNLPEPTIADGSTVMDVKLYTGNGSTQTISGLNFDPDLVWIKGRSGATDHALYDTVRTATKQLESNTTTAETTEATGLTAFATDGFSLGALAQVNTSSATYAAWCWDAGSSTVTNTQGSITSQVRANPTAGFSVVTYTGTLTSPSNVTIGHGLGVAPSLVITKSRSAGGVWPVFSSVLGANKYLELNTTAAVADSVAVGGGAAPVPTSTVFYSPWLIGSNINGENFVAYCFAPVAGYSSFGRYVGNGSSNGPMVFTGMRPRWVMIKASSGAGNHWMLIDSARSNYNQTFNQLYANLVNAEAANNSALDLLSNGFKCRADTFGNINASGVTYIYAAFAEHPFQSSRAR